MEASAAPVVIVLMGLPGSGKTTLAKALAPKIHARIVSRDAVRAAMFHPCSYTDAEKVAAFRAVVDAVGVNCRLGRSSIADAPFSRVGEFEAVSWACEEHGGRAVPVLCSISIEQAQQRIRQQSDSIAFDRDDELVLEVAGRFRALPPGTVELDATRPVDEIVQAVVRLI